MGIGGRFCDLMAALVKDGSCVRIPQQTERMKAANIALFKGKKSGAKGKTQSQKGKKGQQPGKQKQKQKRKKKQSEPGLWACPRGPETQARHDCLNPRSAAGWWSQCLLSCISYPNRCRAGRKIMDFFFRTAHPALGMRHDAYPELWACLAVRPPHFRTP